MLRKQKKIIFIIIITILTLIIFSIKSYATFGGIGEGVGELIENIKKDQAAEQPIGESVTDQQETYEFDPNDYTPGQISESEIAPVTKIAGTIISALSVIGIVIAVITLMIIGLKYMLGSVEEKAEYKKTMIPYLIGTIMVVAITQFLNIIIKIVEGIKV